MATSKYTIAPPSVAPLLHEYGDYENIPDEAWDEYCAAQAYWSRTRRMYQGGGHKARKPQQSETGAKGAIEGPDASAPTAVKKAGGGR
jgi:hypothetical protein